MCCSCLWHFWCEGGLLVHVWASSYSRSVAANVAAWRFVAESSHSQCSQRSVTTTSLMSIVSISFFFIMQFFSWSCSRQRVIHSKEGSSSCQKVSKLVCLLPLVPLLETVATKYSLAPRSTVLWQPNSFTQWQFSPCLLYTSPSPRD